MISHTTDKFRKAFLNLPGRFKSLSPGNPLLHFKQVHQIKPVYSIRIGLGWRAVGIKSENHLIWFWVGSHSNYDKLVKQL